ncbi:MAG: EF-hand domain-containing protein [Gemmataceae bacterium]
MTQRTSLTLLLAGLATVATAAEKAVPSPETAQPIVFMGANRPVLLHLHIEMDGQPFTTVWNETLSALFSYLDQDDDGVLNEPEVTGRVPNVQQMLQILRGGFFNRIGGASVRFADLDQDGDGEVTEEEFLGYYQRANLGALQLGANPTVNPLGNALTDALFTHLDTNKDGKLSKEEIQAAETILRKLDLNDDEMISANELVPTAGFNPVPPGGFGTTPSNSAAALLNFGFYVVMPDASPNGMTQRLAVAQQLLDRYDKDKDNKLSATEIKLERTLFTRLDANEDGFLNLVELTDWLRRPADVTIILRLGEFQGEAVEIVPVQGGLAGLSVQPTGSGLTLSLDDAQIHIESLNTPTAIILNNLQNARRFIDQQFANADKDKKGYLTRQEVQAPQLRNLLAPLFDFADRNRDDKLTKEELNDYYDLVTKMVNSYAMLAAGDQGRGLFEIVDANRDSQLGIRELRTMWDRLAEVMNLEDEVIDRAAIPRQLQLRVGRGVSGYYYRGLQVPMVGRPGVGPTANPVPSRGPLWFRKMDRNGDGDISPREWLGSKEEFERIDADGDGLISRAEAEAADALLRRAAQAP